MKPLGPISWPSGFFRQLSELDAIDDLIYLVFPCVDGGVYFQFRFINAWGNKVFE